MHGAKVVLNLVTHIHTRSQRGRGKSSPLVSESTQLLCLPRSFTVQPLLTPHCHWAVSGCLLRCLYFLLEVSVFQPLILLRTCVLGTYLARSTVLHSQCSDVSYHSSLFSSELIFP